VSSKGKGVQPRSTRHHCCLPMFLRVPSEDPWLEAECHRVELLLLLREIPDHSQAASGKPALVNVLTDPEVVYPRKANLA
jgi:hypothetical protein